MRHGLVETLEFSAALVTHRKTQSMPDSSPIITFPSNLRNVRRFALPKCSTLGCAESSKLQAPSTREAPGTHLKIQRPTLFWSFRVGDSLGFGAYEVGRFNRSKSKAPAGFKLRLERAA